MKKQNQADHIVRNGILVVQRAINSITKDKQAIELRLASIQTTIKVIAVRLDEMDRALKKLIENNKNNFNNQD